MKNQNLKIPLQLISTVSPSKTPVIAMTKSTIYSLISERSENNE